MHGFSTLGKTEIQNKDFSKIRGFSSPFNEQGANPDNLVTVTRIQLKDRNPTSWKTLFHRRILIWRISTDAITCYIYTRFYTQSFYDILERFVREIK